jgi:NAD(P)-dependent dehydrogenase (short-subunit alcohol dehydrogenase family)
MQVRAIAGLMGVMPDGTYAATKAALRSDARTWTAELAAQDIRLNVGALGPTETAVRARVPEARWARLIAPIRLGRMARLKKGAATLFLLSDEVSVVAGAEPCVDGGMRQISLPGLGFSVSAPDSLHPRKRTGGNPPV